MMRNAVRRQRTNPLVLGLAAAGTAVAVAYQHWDALLAGWAGLGLSWLAWRTRGSA